MSPRTLWFHVVAAALALLFAYGQAHKQEENKGGPTSVVLLDAKKGAVRHVPAS